MTIEVVSFIVGSILVGVAIIGGGFEIKELKIPRVGMLARFASLVIGGFFVFLGLGMAQMQGEAAAAAPGTSGSASFAPGRESTTSAASTAGTAREAAGASAGSGSAAANQGAAKGGFTGFSGRARISWVIGQTTLVGMMDLATGNGTMLVSYLDPQTGQQVDVAQDLVLRQSERGFYYESYNPRFAATQQPFPEYRPDFFFVGPHQAGGWTFTQVCDQYQCAPVTVEPM